MPRQKLNNGGRLAIPEAVRAYLELRPGDWIEFISMPGCRVRVGRAARDIGRPVRVSASLTTQGVTLPSTVLRHLQAEPGSEIEFRRLDDGGIELEKANTPRGRHAVESQVDSGQRGPARGLDIFVSIGIEHE